MKLKKILIKSRIKKLNFKIAAILMIFVLALTSCDKKIPSNEVIAPVENGKNTEQAETRYFELRKEYFELMGDLDNIRYFSNFTSQEEILEDELVLFGFMKASRDGKGFLVDEYSCVKLEDIIPYTEKYFNRKIIGKKDTSYFTYNKEKGYYKATGWDFHGAEPHYLTEILYNSDGSITAAFDVYYFGELDLENQFPKDYISDTSLIPSIIKHVRAESTFYIKEQDGKKYIQVISYKRFNSKASSENAFKAVSFSSDKYLSDDEFVIAGGVKLGMSYEEVLEILKGYDEAYENTPDVKSIIKDGYHYGFYKINETFTDQSDLKIDGVFRLLHVDLTQLSDDEFPRGIKIGDSIEDVLNKFPGKDKKLRKWAHQNIYGKDEKGKPRAYLAFTMYNECYYFFATTSKQSLIVHFDRKNKVNSIELNKADL